MGRIYSVTMDAQSISAAGDLLHVVPGANTIVVVHRIVVVQDASETSEQLPIQIHRAEAAGSPTPAGTATTPAPHDPGDAAFTGTVLTGLTTDTQSTTLLHRESFNVLTGWDYHPTPEERILVPAGTELAVRLDAAPGAALTMTLQAVIEELG